MRFRHQRQKKILIGGSISLSCTVQTQNYALSYSRMIKNIEPSLEACCLNILDWKEKYRHKIEWHSAAGPVRPYLVGPSSPSPRILSLSFFSPSLRLRRPMHFCFLGSQYNKAVTASLAASDKRSGRTEGRRRLAPRSVRSWSIQNPDDDELPCRC